MCIYLSPYKEIVQQFYTYGKLTAGQRIKC